MAHKHPSNMEKQILGKDKPGQTFPKVSACMNSMGKLDSGPIAPLLPLGGRASGSRGPPPGGILWHGV